MVFAREVISLQNTILISWEKVNLYTRQFICEALFERF